MKKNVLTLLLPALLVLAACGGTTTSSSEETASSMPGEETSSSSTVTEETSSSTPIEIPDSSSEEVLPPSSSSAEEETPTSSSSEEDDEPVIVIPTVTPTIHVTVEGITVLEENGIYIGSPNLEGASADVWGYAEMTLDSDGTYSYTFPETEIEQYILFQIYVQNKEGNDWSGVLCDECAGNKDIQVLTLEDKNDYDVTVTFSSQPDSSNAVEDVTFTLTATDSQGNPIDQEGLYIIAYDSMNGGGAETVWTNNGNGVYSYTYDSIPVGAFTINPYLEATDDITKITWNKSDTLGEAGYHFDIKAGVNAYNFAATWSNIPTPSTGDGYNVSITLVLTSSLDEGAEGPQIVFDDSWIKLTATDDELTWTYESTYAEGAHSFYFYWWNASEGDHKIFADGNGTYFSLDLTGDVEMTVTGAFSGATSVGTIV